MEDLTDLRRYPEVIAAINAILSNGGIAEVKYEAKGLTVVAIERKLKYPEKVPKK